MQRNDPHTGASAEPRLSADLLEPIEERRELRLSLLQTDPVAQPTDHPRSQRGRQIGLVVFSRCDRAHPARHGGPNVSAAGKAEALRHHPNNGMLYAIE